MGAVLNIGNLYEIHSSYFWNDSLIFLVVEIMLNGAVFNIRLDIFAPVIKCQSSKKGKII
jgi:hypothetical protein